MHLLSVFMLCTAPFVASFHVVPGDSVEIVEQHTVWLLEDRMLPLTVLEGNAVYYPTSGGHGPAGLHVYSPTARVQFSGKGKIRASTWTGSMVRVRFWHPVLQLWDIEELNYCNCETPSHDWQYELWVDDHPTAVKIKAWGEVKELYR